MKKVLFAIVALCCLTLTSCFKESEYTITYSDKSTSIANVTIFEYDYTSLVTKHEIKNISTDEIYSFTSSDIADRIVIGVEGIMAGRITEWYTRDYYRLDPEKPIHIDVNFMNMDTQDTNPINPEDHVSRYLYKK